MGGELLQAGIGGRPLLLVHGFTGAKEDFGEAVPRLGELGWHAVAGDLPGHGPGPHPHGPYSLSGFADHIGAVVDGLGWERFVLLGHSMGGMAAQLFALAHPERVQALVLMNTGHGPVDTIDPALVAVGQQLVRDGGLDALAEYGKDSMFGSLAHQRVLAERPGYAEFGDAKLLACSPQMWLAMSVELRDHPDRLEHLRSLDVPTLVVVGDQDEAFLEQSERMAKVLPDARLVVVADAGHAPQFEQPESWWRAIAAFLEEVG
ncbi:MAG TPA: alpha/beta fold hydrolase [Acidimicrobiales bacterium]|nr:alpha/beta fold hydrolase [Acidimicrobiales bacterium]